MNDLTLGEQEQVERMSSVTFDEDGKVKSANASGGTIAAVYIAWKRVDPTNASESKVRNLRQHQYDIEEIKEDEASPPVEEAAGADVLSLERPGNQSTSELTESGPTKSTASQRAS